MAATAKKVAIIGSGTMGSPIGLNVAAAGYEVTVFDRVDAATTDLAQAGAAVCSSAAEACDGADFALLSLPGPAQVVEAVVGEGGVLSARNPPAMVIDVSTNSPEAVRNLREACEGAGVGFVDAPVSGGVAKARSGELAVLVGADPAQYEAAKAVLDTFGADVMHVGPSGSGTIAKIVNNQLFLAGAVLVQEAYGLAAALGMDPADAHEVIKASSGAPYAKLAPLLLSRRFDDVIFRLDIASKDVALAELAASDAGLDLPMTRAAAAVYQAAVDAGDGDEVFHATVKELERRTDGLEIPALKRRPRT